MIDTFIECYTSGTEIAVYTTVFVLWVMAGTLAATSGFLGRAFSATAYEFARHWNDAAIMLEQDNSERPQRAISVHILLSLPSKSEFAVSKAAELTYQGALSDLEARAFGRTLGSWVASAFVAKRDAPSRQKFETHLLRVLSDDVC